MAKFVKYASHVLATTHEEGLAKQSNNHFIAPSSDLQNKIASMGLERVAGNIYKCPSKQDFWKVRGNKIVKLVSNEVDDGSSIASAPKDTPMSFLTNVLDDLTL